jgi:hypothetical protein
MAKYEPMTRRMLFDAGGWVVAAAVGVLYGDAAHSAPKSGLDTEAAVRKYYELWETNDWEPMDRLLAKTFTFTSAAGDDHISKNEFKKQCWDTQIANTKGFDLLQLVAHGNSAFVMYVGHTKNDRSFRNVEFVEVKNGQVMSIECYFGQANSFPSAVSNKKT